MKSTELLDVNVHRYFREASPADICRTLRAAAEQLRARELPGWAKVALAAGELHECLHASAAADAITRAFRARPRAAE